MASSASSATHEDRWDGGRMPAIVFLGARAVLTRWAINCGLSTPRRQVVVPQDARRDGPPGCPAGCESPEPLRVGAAP